MLATRHTWVLLVPLGPAPCKLVCNFRGDGLQHSSKVHGHPMDPQCLRVLGSLLVPYLCNGNKLLLVLHVSTVLELQLAADEDATLPCICSIAIMYMTQARCPHKYDARMLKNSYSQAAFR